MQDMTHTPQSSPGNDFPSELHWVHLKLHNPETNKKIKKKNTQNYTALWPSPGTQAFIVISLYLV